jgi:hypothetical protein
MANVQCYLCVINIILLISIVSIMIYCKNRNENLENVLNTNEWYEMGPSESINWNGVDRVYFITLFSRLENVKKIIKKMGLTDKVWILKAIDKDIIDISEYKNENLKKNPGKIACHLSHLECIKHFKQSKLGNALIFEDDLKIPKGTEGNKIKYVLDVVNKVDPNWNMIYLGYCWEHKSKTKPINKDVLKLYRPLCRHAYMINKNIVNDYINKVSKIEENGDVSIGEFIKDGTWSVYGPMKVIFEQYREKWGSNLNNNNKINQFVKF